LQYHFLRITVRKDRKRSDVEMTDGLFFILKYLQLLK
jgi:hypothetical protein